MKKFVYIILHYKNLKDTIECIESIRKFSDNPIVIVDNHTLSKTDKKALDKYTKDIIMLSENMGFAKANNIGVQYAKEKYNPNFYIVLNNDIVINDRNFQNTIIEDYKKYEFDILGPRIDTNKGNSVNPFPVYKDEETVKRAIKKAKRNISIQQSRFLYYLFSIYHTIKYSFKKETYLLNGEKVEKKIAIHGCAMIFSKKYIEKYKYALYNETFLYHEEEFLFYRVQRDNLISIYDPSLYCFHKEGASLNHLFNNNNRQKEIFRQKEILKSLEKLYEIMKENKSI